MLQKFDPLRDPRWRKFLDWHPEASVFHSPEWLEALRRTYGYRPVGYTTCSPDMELRDGQVFCLINSWLTGRRLVSLPFSDHTAILANTACKQVELLQSMQSQLRIMRCGYVEVRPLSDLLDVPQFQAGPSYYLHRLSLETAPRTIFQRFHKSCIQRKIRKAERERLQYVAGRSEQVLQQFYSLLLLAHARHHVPPQPLDWFRNLLTCLGDGITIHIALKDGRPVAGIITLAYKSKVTYKYGGSDARFHRLGAVPFLFWHTIVEAQQQGFKEFDLGRTDLGNSGLVRFKEHLGSQSAMLTYWRCGTEVNTVRRWESKAARAVCRHAPTRILPLAGRLLYRHIG